MFALLLVLQVHAQQYGETPCNLAVQEFKKTCGRFVAQYSPKLEEPEAEEEKRCERVRKIAPEAEQKFKEVCGSAADTATRRCQQYQTGGISGESGTTTMAEDLNDMNGVLKYFHDEFMRNVSENSCPPPKVG